MAAVAVAALVAAEVVVAFDTLAAVAVSVVVAVEVAAVWAVVAAAEKRWRGLRR